MDFLDYNVKVFQIPSSCCGLYNVTSGEEKGNCSLAELVEIKGCGSLFSDFHPNYSKTYLIKNVLLGLHIVLHLLTIILSIILSKKIKKQNESKSSQTSVKDNQK